VLRQERLSGALRGAPVRAAGLLILATLAAAASACGPATAAGAVSDEPPIAPAERTERASHYGGPAEPVQLTPAERRLYSSVIGTNPSCRCAEDPRLIITARRHAADLASSGRPPTDSDLEHLRFALLAVGGTDYALQPLVIPNDARGRASLTEYVLAHGDRWTHCGVGLAGDGDEQLAVWIGVERAIELGPLPLRPQVGVELEVVGRTLTGRPVPIEPYLGKPDGSVSRLRPSNGWSGVSGGRFSIGVPIDSAGRYELELLVDTGRGLETSVLLPLYAGVEPETGPLITLDAPQDSGEHPAIDSLADLIAREREKLSLAPLTRDPRLDRLAAAHSRDMVARAFFGHRSPDGDVLADRLQRIGLAPVISAENIARSRSVGRVHRNLMQSPSHRLNIVEPEFTHLGLGVARDGDDVVVTEIFVRW
jgi:hypothetical protein